MDTLVVLFTGGFAAWLMLAGLRVLARGAASGWRGWRQRRHDRRPAPPELTAPLPDWAAQQRPTWQRRGQSVPALTPSSAATPPPLAQTLPSGQVIF